MLLSSVLLRSPAHFRDVVETGWERSSLENPIGGKGKARPGWFAEEQNLAFPGLYGIDQLKTSNSYKSSAWGNGKATADLAMRLR